MVNYQNGKIYQIRSIEGDLTYYGSTTNPLCKRMTKHRSNYKAFQAGKFARITSFDVLAFDDAQITLVELAPCNTKEELTAIERRYIEANPCVNKYIPGQTRAEYRVNNKEKIAEYYQKNAEKAKEKFDCQCGGKFTHANRATHFRSIKHVNHERAQQEA